MSTTANIWIRHTVGSRPQLEVCRAVKALWSVQRVLSAGRGSLNINRNSDSSVCVCVCGPPTFCRGFLVDRLLSSSCQATPSGRASELSFGIHVSWQQCWVQGDSFPFAEAFCSLSSRSHGAAAAVYLL